MTNQISRRKRVYQPLRLWPYQVPELLTPDISVVGVPELLDESDASIRWRFSGYEIQQLKQCSAWLSCEFDDKLGIDRGAQDRAIESVKNSQLAFQIVAPIGLEHTAIFVTEEVSGGGRPSHSTQTPQMVSIKWAEMARFSGTSLSELKCVLRGVHTAFDKRLTRLTNPMYFLELGLESNHPYLRTFLWATGLDSLLMAEKKSLFVKRLNNFLGKDSFIFPQPDGFEQPTYRVGEIAADLFELRSIVAHGRAMPDKFMSEKGFTNTNGCRIPGYDEIQKYRDILNECALLLLLAALKKVFTQELTGLVAETKSWRQHLSHPSQS